MKNAVATAENTIRDQLLVKLGSSSAAARSMNVWFAGSISLRDRGIQPFRADSFKRSDFIQQRARHY